MFGSVEVGRRPGEHVQGNPGLFLKGFVGVTATRLHIRWLSWDLAFSAQGTVEAHLEHRTLGPKSHILSSRKH